MSFSFLEKAKPVRELTELRLEQEVQPALEYVSREEMLAYRKEPAYQYVVSLVASVYRWLGHEEQRILDMTYLFELLYFSRSFHLKVRDQAEGQQHDRALQYTVLLGDYYLSKALEFLLDKKAGGLIEYFTSVLISGYEGLVEKHKYELAEEITLPKTHGTFYQGIFYSAAKLKDLEPTQPFEQLGYHIGMALEWGLRESEHEKEHQLVLPGLYESLTPAFQHPELEQFIIEFGERGVRAYDGL